MRKDEEMQEFIAVIDEKVPVVMVDPVYDPRMMKILSTHPSFTNTTVINKLLYKNFKKISGIRSI